jgi:branched-chain amino acid aminotransferase
MGLNPTGAPSEIFLACWPWTNYLSDVPAIKVKISKYMRLHPKSVVVDAKVSGYYANSILASLEVRAEGYHEALFLDFQGNVAEGPGENMFIVKNGTVITPPGDFILPGLTRDTILKLAHDLGLKTEEKNFKPEDIYSADEAFMTGTASEVAPIENVDGKIIGKGGVGPVTAELKQAYLDVVHGKNPKYESWLTYCD